MDKLQANLDGIYSVLKQYLFPARPVVSVEHLKGREHEFNDVLECLKISSGTPIIFGNRGVGKTSMAKTVAQMYSGEDREPVYVACGPHSTALNVFRDIAVRLSEQAIQLKAISKKQMEIQSVIGLSPSLRFTSRAIKSEAPKFSDASEAVRVLKDFDNILPHPEKTVVVIDELEELDPKGQKDLAYFVKQIGDQEFSIRFIFVGIADSIHQLIGAHQSSPRYLRNVELGPLSPQALIDIVTDAAMKVGIKVPPNVLARIAIVGNGYPHFAHLMGLHLLVEAVGRGLSLVDDDVYKGSLASAVRGGIEELKASYESAVQRGSNGYRDVVWAMANENTVDLRTDQIVTGIEELAKRRFDMPLSDIEVQKILNRLRTLKYGHIICHTPKRYGSNDPKERRYRHHRFTLNLMRGYVRLRAEAEGFQLGTQVGL